MNKILMAGPDIGQQMEYMLATGNLRSKTGLGFQQVINREAIKLLYHI